MTVGELKKALKGFGDSDEVYMVKDWSATNERGELTELAELSAVVDHLIVEDVGLDFVDYRQVLLDFKED